MLELLRKPIPWKPHSYQKRAMKFLLEHAGAGLFLDPGLVKTSIVLGALNVLKKAKQFDRVLIIAPLRVCYSVWPEEIKKWSDFKDFKISILHGDHKDKALKTDADIYIINPAGLPWLFEPNNLKILKSKHKVAHLVVDESTQFKYPDTARFKLLKKVLASFGRRWILTGSPAPNGLADLFGQIFICDLGKSLGRFITHFRMTYFYPTGFGGYDWELKDGADELIYKQVKPFVLRLAAKDYLELPQMIIKPQLVELPPKAMKMYNEMERELVAELSADKLVTAVNAAAASNKCEQIANGGIYHIEFDDDNFSEGRRTWTDVHSAKIEMVEELLESIQGNQALVAYGFQHDLARLRTALGKKTPYIGSGVSPAEGQKIEAQWNARKIPVLLGHPASMGHGLNMQTGGNHVIWHSLTWNREHWEQFNQRILRQGSIHKFVFVYPIIAKGTVDEAKWFSLGRKGDVQDNLLTALKRYVKEKYK